MAERLWRCSGQGDDEFAADVSGLAEPVSLAQLGEREFRGDRHAEAAGFEQSWAATVRA